MVRIEKEEKFDDPVMLDHSCLPVERTRDKAERLCYKMFEPQRIFIAVDPVLAQNRRRYRNNVMGRAIKKTIQEIDMLHVPDEFLYFSDGALFLQLQEQDLHIYLSDEVPLMFTITRNKREQDYMVIFQQLREVSYVPTRSQKNCNSGLSLTSRWQQLTQRNECSLASPLRDVAGISAKPGLEKEIA
ncbi:unnamed protein product [Strongylus vulgaris]|uniref:Uncharacterized protein n=1 Tax=Strongylus vulgaris TaxID=40348 RepID=A0A3P7J766_STRVU|nr:unnamed protein product [Strongylus vulgaris]